MLEISLISGSASCKVAGRQGIRRSRFFNEKAARCLLKDTRINETLCLILMARYETHLGAHLSTRKKEPAKPLRLSSFARTLHSTIKLGAVACNLQSTLSEHFDGRMEEGTCHQTTKT